MSPTFFYIGANVSGFLVVNNAQGGRPARLELKEPLLNEHSQEEAVRRRFIQKYLADRQAANVDLLVDNVSESIVWRGAGLAENNTADIMRAQAANLTRHAQRTQRRNPKRVGVNFQLTDDSDCLGTTNRFSTDRARRNLCSCLVNTRSPKQPVERKLDCADQQMTLAWYNDIAHLVDRRPSIYSLSLLLESAFLSIDLEKHCLVAMTGTGSQEAGVVERHLYFRSGRLCFSRLVRISHSKLDSEAESQILDQRSSTATYIEKHMTTAVASACSCDSSNVLNASDFKTFSLFNTGALASTPQIETTDCRADDFRASLIRHLQIVANRKSYVIARESSQVCRATRLENSVIRHSRQRNRIAYGQTVSMQFALAFFVAVLCWQCLKVFSQYQLSESLAGRIEQQTAALTQAHTQWHGRLSTDNHTDSAPERSENPPIEFNDRRYRGFTTSEIDWLTASQFRMIEQSLVQPVAFLVKEKILLDAMPDIVMTGVSWEPAVMPDHTLSAKSAPALRISLDGRVSSVATIESQLDQFENYLQTLQAAYRDIVIERVVYPFGVSPDGMMSGALKADDTTSHDARANYRIEMLVALAALADEVSEVRNLLVENNLANTGLYTVGMN